MQSDDVPALEAHLRDFRDASRQLRDDVRKMAITMTDMANTCQGEPELISLLEKEGRRLSALRDLLESDNLERQMTRRLPRISARIQEEERIAKRESSQIQQEAVQVHQYLSDILQSFLRGGS